MARAIVFDYFGTLTPLIGAVEREAAHHKVAHALGVPAEPFVRLLRRTLQLRITGATGGVEETLRWAADQLGQHVTDSQVRAAAAVRRRVQEKFRALRPNAAPVVRKLKERGYLLGLLSDCSSELPEEWPNNPLHPFFDAAVFSFEEHLSKPSPKLFERVMEELGVPAADVMYIGDGGGDELRGATEAGMRAVRFVPPEAGEPAESSANHWKADVIADLPSLLTRLDLPSAGFSAAE